MQDNLSILLVEDNDDDQFFFQRLITKAGLRPSLAVSTDGQQAIEHLRQQIEADSPPRLEFLDLKLPLLGGFEVLQWIRSQSALARMVVVALSSSSETRDIEQAYALGAQGYLVKYPAAAVFQEISRQVHELKEDVAPGSLDVPEFLRP